MKKDHKPLNVQVRAAFAATGPVALEELIAEMADRITALEVALDLATAPAVE